MNTPHITIPAVTISTQPRLLPSLAGGGEMTGPGLLDWPSDGEFASVALLEYRLEPTVRNVDRESVAIRKSHRG